MEFFEQVTEMIHGRQEEKNRGEKITCKVEATTLVMKNVAQ